MLFENANSLLVVSFCVKFIPFFNDRWKKVFREMFCLNDYFLRLTKNPPHFMSFSILNFVTFLTLLIRNCNKVYNHDILIIQYLISLKISDYGRMNIVVLSTESKTGNIRTLGEIHILVTLISHYL